MSIATDPKDVAVTSKKDINFGVPTKPIDNLNMIR